MLIEYPYASRPICTRPYFIFMCPRKCSFCSCYSLPQWMGVGRVEWVVCPWASTILSFWTRDDSSATESRCGPAFCAASSGSGCSRTAHCLSTTRKEVFSRAGPAWPRCSTLFPFGSAPHMVSTLKTKYLSQHELIRNYPQRKVICSVAVVHLAYDFWSHVARSAACILRIVLLCLPRNPQIRDS